MMAAGWAEVGERLREARIAAGLTQSQLSAAVGIERTALLRAESGERKLDALELYSLATQLSLPLSYFVAEPPAAAVSRRTGFADDVTEAERGQWYLDVDLAAHARDAEWLHTHRLLSPPGDLPSVSLHSDESARTSARAVRERLGLRPSQPVGGMAAACEQLGLYVLSVPRPGDGASLEGAGYGVAVVSGQSQPGRRRLTAAHELGHYLSGDAYSNDVGLADRSDSELRIDVFASELLLPRDHVRAALAGASADQVRDRLVVLAGLFRVSWTLAVRTAADVTGVAAGGLMARPALGADFQIHLGYEPEPDLPVGQTGPVWRKAVMAAFRGDLLTAVRAREMLHGAVTVDEVLEAAEGDG